MRKIFILLILCFFASSALLASDLRRELEKVDSLLETFHLKQALGLLKKLETTNSNSFDINYKKGSAYLGLGKYKLAVEAYNKCASIQPKNALPYEILGNLYAQFRDTKRSIQNFQKAYLYTKSVENKLSYKIEILNIMLVSKNLKSFQKHIIDAQKIVPNNFDINFMLARYYNEIEDYKNAVKILGQLIKEVPNVPGNEQYFYELGLALHHLKRYSESQSTLKNINRGAYKIRAKALNDHHYVLVAKAYRDIFDYEKANYYLDIAFKLNQHQHEIPIIRAEINSITKDNSRRINALELEIKNSKSSNNLEKRKSELVLLKFRAGDYTETIFLCDQLLSNNIKNINILFLKVIAEYKLGEYNPIHVETIAKLAFNNNIEAHNRGIFAFSAGVIYYKNKELDLAKQMLNRARVGVFKQAANDILKQIYKEQRYGSLWKGDKRKK